MILDFRPIKVWPEGWQDSDRYQTREGSPFTGSYSSTLKILDRELDQLGATAVTLQVDATDRDLRLDGQLRSDAKPRHPGVILTIETKRHGTLVYATDRFEGRWGTAGWQSNLRAIALGLEALRKVERYGIAERGQQYAGYRELGTGIALGAAPMSIEEAARLLAEHDTSGVTADDLLVEVGMEEQPWITGAYRMAAKVHHPDVGGDPDLFRRLTEARDLLAAAS